jgi:hypothetical protein
MTPKVFFSAASLLVPALVAGQEKTAFAVHGQAWFEGGRIMSAEDSIINGEAPDNILNLQGNLLQGMGAQITLEADLAENLEGAFGFGVHKVGHAFGKNANNLLAITLFQNFLTESRLTWYAGEKAEPSFSATLGAFPYKYNGDVKNLGLYLLRGSVYPGILMGGFNDFATDSTKATQLGLRLHHRAGAFSHDLILNSEREIPPTFDWSLAYVAKVQAGGLTFGGGANFYRLIPYDDRLLTPGKHFTDTELGFKKAQYIEVGPSGTDTVFFTHQGIKLMGMFSLDFQRMLGMELAHPDDLKLYGEAAVIGVQNYGTAYNDIAKRIPVMLGFNVPTGGLLSHLSLEVEYYGARYRNDLVRVGNNNVVAPWTIQAHPVPSAKPPGYENYGIDSAGNWINSAAGDTLHVKGTAMDKINQTKDDIKWSLLAEKVIGNHLSIMAQVANDHYRPKPVATGLIKSEGGTQEAFASPKDWYFMLRMGYFF